MYTIRYITSTNIGEWARDKLSRLTLLPRGVEPIMWDFGSAARHHELYCGRSWAGLSLLRGAMTPDTGVAENVDGVDITRRCPYRVARLGARIRRGGRPRRDVRRRPSGHQSVVRALDVNGGVLMV